MLVNIMVWIPFNKPLLPAELQGLGGRVRGRETERWALMGHHILHPL